ncbi:unnamed protein product [Peniophora sp. CBMAI 1063]|nr:unnamed protein product [Peniophora sp. CBMAI 1063]
MRVIGAWLQAVPRLKHLSLTQTRETRRGDASTVEHIEASLFIAPAAVALIPELTALHVDGLDLELTSDIFLNLVELSFTRTTFHDTPRRGNPANLRAVFQRMQKLRKLALVDVRFGSFPDNDIGLPPSLHHLEYSGGSLDALSRLKPSASVRVKLIRTGPPITASKYRDTPILVDVFNAWLGSETPATAVRLTSRSNSHTSEVRVAYWRNTGSHANGLAPDFEFNRRFDGTSWVEDIITGSTHNNITHATLDVDWDSPLFRGKADWLECFGPLPYLHTLMLTGPPMETPVHTVVQQLVLPAHMATVLDEMVSTADVGVVGWRTLVSDVHVRRLA